MIDHYTPPATPNLFEAISDIPLAQYGRRANHEQRVRIEAALRSIGVVGEEQSQESIGQGIADARWLAQTSSAAETLREHAFVDEENLDTYLVGDFPSASVDFAPSDLITLDWSKIDGAASFDSWQGRGLEGTGEVDGAASSLDKILDFATRDTNLPPIELLVILTPDGPISIAGNSHRAAAAILRNENIGCDYLKVIDARMQEKS